MRVIITKRKNSKGQTQLEAIIAIMIIAVALLGVVELIYQSYISTASAKYRTQAIFLAQEGVEIASIIRDTTYNKMKAAEPGISRWDQRLYDSVNGDGWYVKRNITDPSYPSRSIYSLERKSNENPPSSGDADTLVNYGDVAFTRYIYLKKTSDTSHEVTVTINWPERGSTNSISVSAQLSKRNN